MKIFLVLLNLLTYATCCHVNALELEKYDSLVVVGHLFPIYKIYFLLGSKRLRSKGLSTNF